MTDKSKQESEHIALKYNANDLYTIVCWPEIQYLMDKEGFKTHCHLINDNFGLEVYGSSAYFCNIAWINEVC